MPCSGVCTFYVGPVELNIVSLVNWVIAAVLTESDKCFFFPVFDCLVDIFWLSSHVVPLLHGLVQSPNLIHRLVQ